MPKARINVSTHEANLLPPPPGEGGFSNVYRWDGERIWRTKVGRKHYAYRSMPGMEGWVEVDGAEACLVVGEIMVPDQLEEMGIPIPPGGTYADVYMLKRERALRASTYAGDWFLVNPQQGWLCASPRPDQVTDAKALNAAVRAGLIDLPMVEELPPDEDCSVRVRNIRRMAHQGRTP